MRWLKNVEEHDYTGALSYLTLEFNASLAEELVKMFREARVVSFRANDILRAARLQPASRKDPGVIKNARKIARGKPLSPVLLVNYDQGADIADGYHRVSAVYYEDPYAPVHAKLV